MDSVVETSSYRLSGLNSKLIKVQRKHSTNFGELWLKVSGKTTVQLR